MDTPLTDKIHKPHCRDTETQIWMRDGKHWVSRKEHEEMLRMSDRELKMCYRKWSAQDDKNNKRKNQTD